MAHLSQMISFAGQAMQGGLPIVTPENMYNLGSALVKAMGYQNVDDYLTPPPPPQPEQPSPEEQLKQAEMQVKFKELEIKQGELQAKFAKIQQDAQEAAMDAQLKVAELALEEKQNRAVGLGRT
jgi:hypothetical protein